MKKYLPEEIKGEIINQIQDVEKLINIRESIYPNYKTQIDKQIFKCISFSDGDATTRVSYLYKEDRFISVQSKPEHTISIGLGPQKNILLYCKELSDLKLHFPFVQDVVFGNSGTPADRTESYESQVLIEFFAAAVNLLRITIISDKFKFESALKNMQISSLTLVDCSYEFFKSIGQAMAPLSSLKTLEIQDSIYIVDSEELNLFFPNLHELKISNVYDTTRFKNSEKLSLILPSLRNLDIECEFFEINGELDISSLEILNLNINDGIEGLKLNPGDSRKLDRFSLLCPTIEAESLINILNKVSFVTFLHLKLQTKLENLNLSVFDSLKSCKIEIQNPKNFKLPSKLQELDINCDTFAIDNDCLSNVSDTLSCLKLYGCKIHDVKQISSLRKLSELYLEDNRLSSFDITGFKELKVLHILDNNLTEFQIPENSNQYELRSLKLSYNSISKISNMQLLQKLETLHLNNNKLSDVSEIKNMPNLAHVDLRENLIKTFFNFVGLINLESVNSSHNKELEKLEIVETKPLNIESLNFESCGLKAIPSSFENMQNLSSLNFAKNSISEFPKIINCPNLKTIDFSRNCITGKIQNLDQFSNLVELNLAFNKIEEIDSLPLNVFELKLYCCQLIKICSIENLANLRTLNLEGNKLINVDAIRNCPSLTEINFSSNQLISLPILENLDNLTDFNAADNQITKIGNSPYFLPKLARLDLGNNKLEKESLKSIKNYPSLKFLRISNNGLKKQKTDFENCPNLKKIFL